MSVNEDENEDYAVQIDSDYLENDYDDIKEQLEEEKECNIKWE